MIGASGPDLHAHQVGLRQHGFSEVAARSGVRIVHIDHSPVSHPLDEYGLLQNISTSPQELTIHRFTQILFLICVNLC